jgi:hypothetical protein
MRKSTLVVDVQVGFNDKACIDEIQDSIVTTHKNIQQTLKWNLGTLIVEIELIKKNCIYKKQ